MPREGRGEGLDERSRRAAGQHSNFLAAAGTARTASKMKLTASCSALARRSVTTDSQNASIDFTT